jgi:signal transduction histidine kinase
MRARFTLKGEPKALFPEAEETLLRIAQELLTNATQTRGTLRALAFST